MSHRAGQLGASLAYYSLFSIGPLLLIAIAVAALAFDEEAVRGSVSRQISGLIGTQAANGIEHMLAGAGPHSEGIFATALGVVTLSVGAIGVVVQLKAALNTVFEVPESRVTGVWAFIRTYAISFAVVLAVGFLLLVSLLLSTVLAAAGGLVQTYFSPALLQVANIVVSFAVSTALFAAMFKWLPDTDVSWAHILPGALLTAALFDIGRLLISIYIGRQGLESTYGAAASIVTILIWIYFSSQIFLFGAEFIRAYARQSEAARKSR